MVLAGPLSFAIKNLFPIALGIIGVGFVIAFHEFGHFLLGKLFKVNIPSFSIGFGPKLFSKKIGTTVFSVSAIPIGGYVEAEVGDYAHPKPGSIAAISYWKKMAIIVGGIAFNFIFAYCVFVGLSIIGIPGNRFSTGHSNHIIQKVEKGSAADKAGIKPGEKIIELNGTDTRQEFKTLLELLQKLPQQPATITLEKDGSQRTVEVILGSITVRGKERGSLGVHFGSEPTPPVPFLQALKQGFAITMSISKNTVLGFMRAFSRCSADGLAGPLMMISFSAQTAGHSASLFFLFLAFISISLGVLNLIPLPILDGGQALTYTIEALLQRPIRDKTLEYIHYTCWILMLILFAFLTFKDIIAMWF